MSLDWFTLADPEKTKKGGIQLLLAHFHHSPIKPRWWGWESAMQTKLGYRKGSGSRPFRGPRGWRDRIIEEATSLVCTLGFQAGSTHQSPFSLSGLARRLDGTIPIPPLLTLDQGKTRVQTGLRSSERGILWLAWVLTTAAGHPTGALTQHNRPQGRGHRQADNIHPACLDIRDYGVPLITRLRTHSCRLQVHLRKVLAVFELSLIYASFVL